MTRTVLADRGKTPFERPAGSTDKGQWFKDFDRLRSMHETSRVKCGETLEGIGPSDALGKVYDVLVGPCRRKSR